MATTGSDMWDCCWDLSSDNACYTGFYSAMACRCQTRISAQFVGGMQHWDSRGDGCGSADMCQRGSDHTTRYDRRRMIPPGSTGRRYLPRAPRGRPVARWTHARNRMQRHGGAGCLTGMKRGPSDRRNNRDTKWRESIHCLCHRIGIVVRCRYRAGRERGASDRRSCI